MALFIGALAFSGQANGKEAAAQGNQQQTVAPVRKPPHAAPEAQQPAKGCPGSHHPEVNCAAISANADEDQARNAENQTWWFRWEVGLTFLTLLVATGAMLFARSAAIHTETGAIAARASADLDIARAEPRMDISCQLHIQPRGPDDRVQELSLHARNNGHTEAREFHFLEVKLSVEGFFEKIPLIVRGPAIGDIPHNGSEHGFPFPIPLDKLNNVEARKGAYGGKTVTLDITYSYETVLRKEYTEGGTWQGVFEEIRNPNADNVIQDVRVFPIRLA